MISLKLTNTKSFMSQLLLTDTFDRFLFIEGEIVTFNTFHIDGYMHKEFWDSSGSENVSDYSYWKNVREFCYSVIKGKRTPLSFKFIFSLSPAGIAKLLEQSASDFLPKDVQGLYLNIRFDDYGLHCVTGTSLKTFSMDKSLEKTWDTMVQKFLDQKQISYEIIQ